MTKNSLNVFRFILVLLGALIISSCSHFERKPKEPINQQRIIKPVIRKVERSRQPINDAPRHYQRRVKKEDSKNEQVHNAEYWNPLGLFNRNIFNDPKKTETGAVSITGGINMNDSNAPNAIREDCENSQPNLLWYVIALALCVASLAFNFLRFLFKKY
jgi:hypothetical protein